MPISQKLSHAQLEILKLFTYDLSDRQLAEIKDLLVQYFADQITRDMDNLFEEKDWDESKNEEWAQEHLRTKYNL